jgi:hypothetical protein
MLAIWLNLAKLHNAFETVEKLVSKRLMENA